MFTGNPSVFNQFEFSALRKAKDNNEKMCTYLDDIIKVVDENIDALIAGDYPEEKRDVFKTLQTDLEREWDEQKSLMRQRGGLTAHRVRALNTIWTLMKELLMFLNSHLLMIMQGRRYSNCHSRIVRMSRKSSSTHSKY